MKKLLGILVLGLLWCNVAFAWSFASLGYLSEMGITLVIALGIFLVLATFFYFSLGPPKNNEETKKSSNKKIDKENPPTISEQALFNFISKVWSGRETLPITFWLCFIVINGIISFGSGYLSESNDNNIFLLAAIAANIWAGVGVWNSSTNYQLQKIKAKQPHGWAYAAKIAIVLNFLLLTSQVVVFLGIA